MTTNCALVPLQNVLRLNFVPRACFSKACLAREKNDAKVIRSDDSTKSLVRRREGGRRKE